MGRVTSTAEVDSRSVASLPLAASRESPPPQGSAQATHAWTSVQVLAWAGFVVAAVGISLANYDAYQVGVNTDDASYVILARSLAESAEYGLINRPGPPPASHFPFGYPLLLVPALQLFGGSFAALTALSTAATALNMAIIFWGWGSIVTGRSYWWGVGVAGLYGLSPLTIDHSRRVMSEPVFTTFFLLAVLLAQRAVRGRLSWWWAPAMSLTAVFLLFTRTIGIVLLAAVLAYLFVTLGRRFLRAFFVTAALAALALATIAVATPVSARDLLPTRYFSDNNAVILAGLFAGKDLGPDTHIDPRTSVREVSVQQDRLQSVTSLLVEHVLVNGIRYHLAVDLRKAALPVGGGDREAQLAQRIGLEFLPLALGLVISGLVLGGLIVCLVRRQATLFASSAFLYLVSLLFWMWNDPRLLYPILPQIQLGLLLGIDAVLVVSLNVVRRLHFPWSPPVNFRGNAVVLLVALLLVASAYKSLQIAESRAHVGDLSARTAWLASNAPPSAVVMTEYPETDFLYSGTKTVPYPGIVASPERLGAAFDEARADYFLLAPSIVWQSHFEPRYSERQTSLLPLLDRLVQDGELKVVHHDESRLVKVYERTHSRRRG